VEKERYGHWSSRGYFHPEPDTREPYCIVIPPPNVTSVLHMGHALNNTLQDVLVRWRRMQGYNCLWVPGVDHAGIATQNVVERELSNEGLTRHDLGRDAFVERVFAWKEQYGGAITDQLKRLGCSCDWERERFTMDEGLSLAVREAFVTLYRRGLVYRGKYIINWCPRCGTALADDEVERDEQQGHLWYIRYPLESGDGHVTVATTRPETMLGDVAVAVSPSDPRYAELIGKRAVLPLMGRPIPVIADHAVDKEFGTGALKITPAHDPVDFEIAQRHELQPLCVMNPDGTMNENAGRFSGRDRYDCRQAVVAELLEQGLLEKIEDYPLTAGHCYRCDTVVEPYLSDQWFVRMRPLAEKAIRASREGRVRFHPERWERVYLTWLENVRDWCISRQIWWGHRIPIWYCGDCGHLNVSLSAPESCENCNSTDLTQDEDVLDTWFSSALWPFSTLGWPEKTPDLDFYYPTSVLVTARDIICLWVARMVMMGLEMMEEVPFSDVYIHGTVLDRAGRRMSKSLGNGIDPLDMIAEFGTDAVRYSLMMLTAEGQDVKLWESRFEMGRNFANKLWNASRFCLARVSQSPDKVSTRVPSADKLAYEDRWILSRLNSVIRSCTEALESFRFHEAATTMYEFTWHEFCDWYIEMVKPRIGESAEPSGRAAALSVLAKVLSEVLLLLHPFTPFVTEEVWQGLKKLLPEGELSESIMIAAWPRAQESRISAELEAEMAAVQDVVRGVRNIRNKMDIKERKALSALICTPDEATQADIESRSELIRRMANLDKLDVGIGIQKPEASALEVIARMQLFVPLKGVIDFETERKRLERRLQKGRQQRASLEKQLANPDFLANAPADVIASREERKAELETQLTELRQALRDMPSG